MSILCNFIFRLILNSKLKEIQILNIPTIPVLWSLFKKGFSTNYLCVPLCHYYSADTSTLVVWRRTRTRGGKPYRPSCLSAFLTTLLLTVSPYSLSGQFGFGNIRLWCWTFCDWRQNFVSLYWQNLIQPTSFFEFVFAFFNSAPSQTASRWWCSRWWCRWVSCFYYSTESDKNVKSANLHKPSFAQSMPKMPGGDDGEKKEETAESREEAKEQVITILIIIIKF